MARFQPGQSGNSEGRPRGTPNRRTQLAKLLEPHAEDLIAKVVELAKAGDVNALRICLDKLLPRPKEEPIEFELPQGDLKKSEVLLATGEKIIHAVAHGDLTPEQGKTLTGILAEQRKSIETTELEMRLAQIEATLNKRRNDK